jgi:hypothetical protein
MGGYGSTRWLWHTKRQTVESCLTLSVGDLLRLGALGRGKYWSGSLRWSSGGQTSATVSATVDTAESDGLVRLSYSVNGRPVSLRVPLTSFETRFGGVRWLFVCPLCGEWRAAKLYLPPTAAQFGCRSCHGLTYKSSQESDKRVSQLMRLPHDQLLAGLHNGSVNYVDGIKASMRHLERLDRLLRL